MSTVLDRQPANRRLPDIGIFAEHSSRSLKALDEAYALQRGSNGEWTQRGASGARGSIGDPFHQASEGSRLSSAASRPRLIYSGAHLDAFLGGGRWLLRKVDDVHAKAFEPLQDAVDLSVVSDVDDDKGEIGADVDGFRAQPWQPI